MLLIYQTSKDQLNPELSEAIQQLERHVSIRIEEEEFPAVIGELAGTAINILLSDEVQSFLAAAEIGALTWGVIRVAHALGKKLAIGKDAARVLAAVEAKAEITEPEPEDTWKHPLIWGPMEAVRLSGLGIQDVPAGVGSEQFVFLIAVVVPQPRDRARTYWYLIGEEGSTRASWYTQTMRDRLPPFLRPSVV